MGESPINPHIMKIIKRTNEVVKETRTDENGNTMTTTQKVRKFSLFWGFLNLEIVEEYHEE